MNNDAKGKALTREAILMLLTDSEVAKVSRAEGSPQLIEGDYYVDLENPGAGVRQVHAASPVRPGSVLPRSAVSDATWAKVLRALSGPAAS